jgi:hypothetical protein
LAVQKSAAIVKALTRGLMLRVANAPVYNRTVKSIAMQKGTGAMIIAPVQINCLVVLKLATCDWNCNNQVFNAQVCVIEHRAVDVRWQ